MYCPQNPKSEAALEVACRVRRIDELLSAYIPPTDSWNPVDEAIFKPVDLYRVPLEEARNTQLKAIKFAFAWHYDRNEFYRKYCGMRNVCPGDIRTNEDLSQIPLIPDTIFKQYPAGADFAHWLANVFTGELPDIVIQGPNPKYDDVVNAFNETGLAVMYSSGTSGRHTFIPRDMRTFRSAQYAAAKLRASMIDLNPDHALMLYPNPMRTNLFIGRVTSYFHHLYADVQYAADYAISADLMQGLMGDVRELHGRVRSFEQGKMQKKIVDRAIQWLELHAKTEESIRLHGPPFMLIQILDTLQKYGKHFEFGERGSVATAGGWKLHEHERMQQGDFRQRVRDLLGIPETRCLDLYAMCEGNGWMHQCPEGHFLHAPYTYFKPLVLDDHLMPVGYGKWGRFAFLDALAQSYPGFIISGDRVRLLEHCPVCDRPGPVLDPEVQRAEGEDVRGCAEELRRILAQDLAG